MNITIRQITYRLDGSSMDNRSEECREFQVKGTQIDSIMIYPTSIEQIQILTNEGVLLSVNVRNQTVASVIFNNDGYVTIETRVGTWDNAPKLKPSEVSIV